MACLKKNFSAKSLTENQMKEQQETEERLPQETKLVKPVQSELSPQGQAIQPACTLAVNNMANRRDKVRFESRDIPEIFKESNKKQPKDYRGFEKRRKNRRGAEDRRQDIRFEIDNEDRRKNQGQREDDMTPEFW